MDDYFTPLVMTPASFLSRFDDVSKETRGRDGIRQWDACCPAHNDKNPSLRIGLTSDGRWLLYCRAGCAGADVAAAVGLSLSDLFPKNGIDNDGAFRGFGGIRGARGIEKNFEDRVTDTALFMGKEHSKSRKLTENERRELVEIARRKKSDNWPVSTKGGRR